MSLAEALRRFLRVLIPSLLLLGEVVHHHDSLEEVEHCDLCTTVVDGRKRAPTNLPPALLANGGRPGLEPEFSVSTPSPANQADTAPVHVDLALFGGAVEGPGPLIEEAPARTVRFRSPLLRRGPPREACPRGPPTPT